MYTHTYTPLHIYDQKTTCQFFSGRVASDNYSYIVKWWCYRRGPFCFGLIALKLLWRISNLGERWFNRQAVLGKIDFTRGRKLFLETAALDRRNRCSPLYVGIFEGIGSTKKSALLLCLNQILGAADWNLDSDMGSHKRWYTNQDLILHSGIPYYTLPFAHVLNHDLESSISCMLMQTWLHYSAEHCSLNAIRNYTILTFNNK